MHPSHPARQAGKPSSENLREQVLEVCTYKLKVGGRYVLYIANLDGLVADRRFVPVMVPSGLVPRALHKAVRTWARTGGVIPSWPVA